jgi:SET domain-containing protein
VRPSPIQGLGGFATRRIPKGARVVEYLGERITDEQADERYDDVKMDRHHTFLFSLGDGTSIDAASGGNEARFINHSCAPNCEAVNDEGRIFIEAMRDIQPGEELFYDYAYERADGGDEEDDEEASRLYTCRCGAPTCRGTILAPRKPKKPRKKAAAGAKGQSASRPRKTEGAGTRRKKAETNGKSAKRARR